MATPTKAPTKVRTLFFLTFFVLVFLSNVYLFQGMFHAFAIGAILAGTFYPLHEWFIKRFNLKMAQSSLLTTLVILLLLVLPTIFVTFNISKEAIRFTEQMTSQDFVGKIETLITNIDEKLAPMTRDLGDDFQIKNIFNDYKAKIINFGPSLFKSINNLVGTLFSLLFQLTLSLCATYGLFYYGPALKRYAFDISPLKDTEEQKILDKFNQMNYVTLVGNGVGALLQGIPAAFLFWLFDIPSVFLWFSLMTILAFIPLLGMSLVFIPAGIYLFSLGFTTQAVLLVALCAAIGFIVENVFKPYFVGPRVGLNGLVVLLYIIAGLDIFGIMGIFYGPLFCTLFVTLGEIFVTNYRPSLK